MATPRFPCSPTRRASSSSLSSYGGYLAPEYSWLEWGGMNELDVLSETVLMRDWLRAKLAGEAWSYPVVPGITTAME